MGLDSREIVFLIGYLLLGVRTLLRRVMLKTKNEKKAKLCWAAHILIGGVAIAMMLKMFV